jgi:hypothetical protein
LTLQDHEIDNSNTFSCGGCEGKSSEIRTGDFVESLERFHQSRSVIEDFTSRTLASIPSDFGRLYYVSSLKDANSGRYRHDGLMNLYPEDSVQAALAHCHEELFSRILETSLSHQERDLRQCLGPAGDKFWAVVESWRESRFFRAMCPEGLPGYLDDLFCSNMAALLAIFSEDPANPAQAA